MPRHGGSFVIWSLCSKVPDRMSNDVSATQQLLNQVQQTLVAPNVTKRLTKHHSHLGVIISFIYNVNQQHHFTAFFLYKLCNPVTD